MDDRRSWDRDFGNLVGDRFDELERRGGAAVARRDLAVDLDSGNRPLFARRIDQGDRRLAVVGDRQPGEAEQKIGPPAPSAKIAVGHHREAARLLKFHHLADVVVLELLEFGVGVGAEVMIGIVHAEELETPLLELRWTQQAADVVDVKVWGWHGTMSSFSKCNVTIKKQCAERSYRFARPRLEPSACGPA